MSKQRQAESTHEGSGTQQAPSAPTTEDPGVARAEQVGNGAAQEEMQGEEQGQSEAEGAFDWVVDKGKELVDGAVDAVEDWGLEHLDSVSAVLTYIDAVGLKAAMALITQVSDELAMALVDHLGPMTSRREELWALLDWLKTAHFLAELTAPALQRVVEEALGRGATWLLDEVAKLAPEVLIAMVQLMDTGPIEALLGSGAPLGRAIIEAVWPAGVGVQLSQEAALSIGFLAIGPRSEGTLRHEGGGRLSGKFVVSGDAGLEAGLGGEFRVGEDAQGQSAKFKVGAGGKVEIDLVAPGPTAWDAALLVGMVGGGMLVAESLDYLLGAEAVPLAELITAVAVSGNVTLALEASADFDLAAIAAKTGLELGALRVGVSKMQGDGDIVHSGVIEMEYSQTRYAKLGGSLELESSEGSSESDAKGGTCISVPLPQPGGTLEAGTGVRLRFHADFDRACASNVELELFAAAEAVGLKGEAAIRAGCPESTDLEGLIGVLQALDVSFEFSIADAVARELLEGSGLEVLLDETALEVDGHIAVSSTIDAETTRCLAEAVVAGMEGKDGLERLKRWVTDPLGPDLGDAARLLCLELAQAADLQAKLKADVTVLDLGLSGKITTLFGVGYEVGASLDYEADLLDMGAAPTMSTYQDLIARAQGEADALPAK